MTLQVLKEAKDSITKVLVIGDQILTGSLDCYLRTYDIRMGNLDSDCIGGTYFFINILIILTMHTIKYYYYI